MFKKQKLPGQALHSSVQMLAGLLLTDFPVSAPVKAADDGPGDLGPFTRVGD